MQTPGNGKLLIQILLFKRKRDLRPIFIAWLISVILEIASWQFNITGDANLIMAIVNGSLIWLTLSLLLLVGEYLCYVVFHLWMHLDIASHYIAFAVDGMIVIFSGTILVNILHLTSTPTPCHGVGTSCLACCTAFTQDNLGAKNTSTKFRSREKDPPHRGSFSCQNALVAPLNTTTAPLWPAIVLQRQRAIPAPALKNSPRKNQNPAYFSKKNRPRTKKTQAVLRKLGCLPNDRDLLTKAWVDFVLITRVTITKPSIAAYLCTRMLPFA